MISMARFNEAFPELELPEAVGVQVATAAADLAAERGRKDIARDILAELQGRVRGTHQPHKLIQLGSTPSPATSFLLQSSRLETAGHPPMTSPDAARRKAAGITQGAVAATFFDRVDDSGRKPAVRACSLPGGQQENNKRPTATWSSLRRGLRAVLFFVGFRMPNRRRYRRTLPLLLVNHQLRRLA